MSETAKSVWLVVGQIDYEGDTVLACMGSKDEAESLRARVLGHKGKYGFTKLGYDYVQVREWKVGECGEDITKANL